MQPSVEIDGIRALLATIADPEMPINIVDLGLVEDVRIENTSGAQHITIDVLPTFVGCPALDMIGNDIRAKLRTLPNVGEITVNWIFDPPWSVDRITSAGRTALREHGVTVPESGSKLSVPGHRGEPTRLQTSAVPCPFCGSNSTHLDSQFGPTRCRMIYYCKACRNSFEHMKRVESPT